MPCRAHIAYYPLIHGCIESALFIPSILQILDLGALGYRPAWDKQIEVHAQVLADPAHPGVLILVEHPPVITIGRHPGAQKHLLAPPAMLAARGVELVETDRGGDITFHGPGQLVAYPIINLNTYNLNLHAYMRLLEQIIIDTLAQFQISAQRDPSPTPATGVWVQTLTQNSELRTQNFAKIAAIGVKLRRWTTLHGLALNVTTDLSFFDLINPCGLSPRHLDAKTTLRKDPTDVPSQIPPRRRPHPPTQRNPPITSLPCVKTQGRRAVVSACRHEA